MPTEKRFKTVEAMQDAIDAYFKDCQERKRPYTVQGLALALNFNSRQSLLNYEGYTDANEESYLDTLKKAKLRIEQDKVEGAMMGDYNTAIVIFDLKNNHEHRDRQEYEVTNLDGYEIVEEDEETHSEEQI